MLTSVGLRPPSVSKTDILRPNSFSFFGLTSLTNVHTTIYGKSHIIISCSVNEGAVAEYKAIWELQESIVINTFTYTIICAVVALFMLIHLIFGDGFWCCQLGSS